MAGWSAAVGVTEVMSMPAVVEEEPCLLLFSVVVLKVLWMADAMASIVIAELVITSCRGLKPCYRRRTKGELPDRNRGRITELR